MNPAALALRRWGDRLLRIRATIFAAMALVTHASAAPAGMTFDIREFGAVGIYGPACSVESWGEPIRAPGIGFSVVEFHGSRDVKQVDE